MKLKFEKNKKEEIITSLDGVAFSSQNYIDMVKSIHMGNNLEVGFDEDITPEEQVIIKEMIKGINDINIKTEEDIDLEDIPF